MTKLNKYVKLNKKNFVVGICSAFALLICLTLTICVSIDRQPAVADNLETVQAEMDAMNSQLSQASNVYNQCMIDLETAQNNAQEAQNTIDECNEKINVLSGKLATRVTSVYRNGSGSMIEILLGSTSLTDLTNNLELINKMNQQDANLVSECKNTRETINEQKQVLDENVAVASEKANEAAALKADAEATISVLQEKYNSLSAQEKAAQEAARAAESAAAQQAAEASSGGSGGSGGGGGQGGGGGGGDIPGGGGDAAIVARAQSKLGCPYAWGACGPDSFDCSGLVSFACCGAYTRLGTTYTFLGWPRVSNPGPGNIAVNSEHCGIYTGGGSMIHAPQEGDVVRYGGVQSGMVFVQY